MIIIRGIKYEIINNNKIKYNKTVSVKFKPELLWLIATSFIYAIVSYVELLTISA